MAASMRRLGVASILALATGIPAALPATAGIPTGTYTELETSVPLKGLSGTWRFELFASDGGPGPGTTSQGVRKRNAAGTAWASERWMASGEPLTCAPKLVSCTIDSEDALGSFGSAEGTFTATGPLKTTPIRCFGSDVAYGTRRTRAGVLSGTIVLKTKSATIGTIRNGSGPVRTAAQLPVTVSRSTYDPSVVCPPPSGACTASVTLTMDGFLLGATRQLPTGPGAISLGRRLPTGEAGVTRSQSVSATGPGSGLMTLQTKQTLAGAILDLARAEPFLSGSVSYTGGGLEDTPFLGCDAKRTTGTVTYDLVLRMPGRAPASLADTEQGGLYRTLPS
jgi:hypothetical protein